MKYAFDVNLLDPSSGVCQSVTVRTTGNHSSLIDAAVEAVSASARKLAASTMCFGQVASLVGDTGYRELVERIAQSYRLERVGKVCDEEHRLYLVNGIHSDFPKGGQWSDHVSAADHDDAILQAQFAMALIEWQGDVTVEDFAGFADYMRCETITSIIYDPVPQDQLVDLLGRLSQAGRDILSSGRSALRRFEAVLAEAEAVTEQLAHQPANDSLDRPSRGLEVA